VSMRVAAVQLEVRDGQTPEDRLAAATSAVRGEAERGADLVLLPEMWAPGYFAFDAYEAVAEPLDGPLTTALARRKGCTTPACCSGATARCSRRTGRCTCSATGHGSRSC
jgi:predicted amidohydrolase